MPRLTIHPPAALRSLAAGLLGVWLLQAAVLAQVPSGTILGHVKDAPAVGYVTSIHYDTTTRWPEGEWAYVRCTITHPPAWLRSSICTHRRCHPCPSRLQR